MTPADLKALLEAATPGPWTANILSDANFRPKAEPEDATEFFSVGPRIRDGQTTVRVRDRSGLLQASTDAVLIATLRNLAPELIALWWAVDALMSPEANADSVAFVEDALVKLNAKAKEVGP